MVGEERREVRVERGKEKILRERESGRRSERGSNEF
jgi:hypothetical protein